MGYLQRLLPFLIALGFANDAGHFIEHVAHVQDFVEVFSGMQAITNGARSFAYTGTPIDKKHGDLYNLLMPAGFLCCLSALMRVRRGGFFFLAPPCSTWIFFSSGSTGRTRSRPLGTKAKSMYIKSQNRLVSRICHLLWIAFQRGVYVIIEQPLSSMMEHHPRFRKLMRIFRYFTVELDMGSFGGFSQKPTKLFGNAPWVRKLAKKLTKWEKKVIQMAPEHATVTKFYIDKHGNKKCSAGKGCKKTQSYPIGFGAANAMHYDEFVKSGSTSSDEFACNYSDSEPSNYDSDLEDMFADFEVGPEDFWAMHCPVDQVPEED